MALPSWLTWGALGLVLLGALVILVLTLRQKKTSSSQKQSLYERLGGIYAIAAVVDHFSDNLIDNPVVGRDSANPQLRKWHREQLSRLPGLKFMRTLWVADISGGPYRYQGTVKGKTRVGLGNAHCPLQVSANEFDAVAQELAASLDHFGVPAREKQEVLSAFAAHKEEVTRCG